MFKNYFKIAVRIFKSEKLYVTASVMGLSLGLTSVLIIFLFVKGEAGYDTQYVEYKNIYRLGVSFTDANGNPNNAPLAPGGWAVHLKNVLPDIKSFARCLWVSGPTTVQDERRGNFFLTERIKWAEPEILSILDFDLSQGDKKSALGQVNSVIVSEATAKKIFGDLNPVNQIITVKHPSATYGEEINLVVTGVFKAPPINSHFQVDYVINLNSLKGVFEKNNKVFFDEYLNRNKVGQSLFQTYILSDDHLNKERLNAELRVLSKQLQNSDINFAASGMSVTPILRNIADLHFDDEVSWENEEQVDISNLWIFITIGFLILIISSINYINLTVSRSTKRIKETGIRKSFGSSRSLLVFQFIIESGIVVLLSVLISMIVVLIAIPKCNNLFNMHLNQHDLISKETLFFLAILLVTVTLLSSIYASIFLSGFSPIDAIKERIIISKNGLFSRLLIGFQYFVSMILVVGSLFALDQMEIIKNNNLDINSDKIVCVRLEGPGHNKYNALKNALLLNPKIENVTMANRLPRFNSYAKINTSVYFPGVRDIEYNWNQLNVDTNFLNFFKLKVIAGRNDPFEIPQDSNVYVLNETAVKQLDLTNEQVIGLTIRDYYTKRDGKVIAVVEDFKYTTVRQLVEPLFITPYPIEHDRVIYINIASESLGEMVSFIEKTWKINLPSIGFDYWFLNDEYDRLYRSEKLLSILIQIFAFISISITAFGILGLSSYIIRGREREMAIRKVLGARAIDIHSLIFKDFFILICVTALTASSMAWFIIDHWLSNFVYRVPISAWNFIYAFLLFTGITGSIVIYEVYKLISHNVVKGLRTQ